MFKKDFQGGSHVEVFSAQGRDPLAHWKLTGSVNRDYLKDVRGYVVAMEGGSSTTNTRMQLPKTDKGSLALVQPYLVFQLMVPDGARLAIDLSVVDTGGSRRRIQMSTSQREVAATPLNARVPLVDILTGQWVNLCFDLDSLVSGLFKGQSFKSLEGVAIGGSCLTRRLFTLRSPPPDTTIESTATVGPPLEEIPRAYQMPTGGLTVQTQVLSYANLSSPAHNRQTSATSTVGSSSSAENLTTEERPTHIAFGQKVAIPDHILTSKQANRSTMPSRQSSADSVRKVKEKEEASLDGQSLQPRPPSKPADPTILRVQKKRVRMISGGKQRAGAVSQSSSGGGFKPSSTSVDSGFQTGTSDAASNLSEVSTSQSVNLQDLGSHAHTDPSTLVKKEQTQTVLSSVESHLSQDEHMALDALKHKDQTEMLDDMENQVEHDNGLAGAGLDMSSVSDDYLNSTGDSQMLNISATSSVTRQSELDSSVDEVLYLYRSLPKSAERKQFGVKESMEGGRSAGLDEDFVSPVRENKSKISMHFVPPVAEVRPRSSQNHNVPGAPQHESPSRNEESGVADQLNETRLSDDYDWRQYTSVDGTDLTQSELSLRTRLANASSSQQGTPRALNIGALRSDSDMDGTLSGSVTHSGWTERFKDAAINPIHDSLDTRDMGGMLSPLMGTLTDEPDFAVDPAKGTAEGEELELMYDPQLNCFYDPNTGKYYELAQ